ncbi:hypothetical protein FRX31_033969 [Thalictrum thalictroides]|uniref:Uncharacterized protein n=1 Tax=Thalictrum thalictroides TaxID=46969 RepID=A0A7J6UV22_THATH|nr:hypothetical protein FRX31_033969 [Thalictrum thalictroides]
MLVKRRYSVGLKGFPPESSLHDFQWFTDQLNQEQRENDDQQFEENSDPVVCSHNIFPTHTSAPSKTVSRVLPLSLLSGPTPYHVPSLADHTRVKIQPIHQILSFLSLLAMQLKSLTRQFPKFKLPNLL